MLGSRTLVDAVLQDYRTAPIDAREKALFALIDTINRRSGAIRKEDVDEAKAAGWSDEALYDAMTVCALFNFYNRWITATGVPVMSVESHRQQGKALAARGYVRD